MRDMKRALTNEKLGTIEDVVGALTLAATAADLNGQVMLVDPRGVLVTTGGRFSNLSLPRL